ncbi:S8 family serine peptidase [Mycoplasma sp. 1018B]|uniref:S8 family serine peptidase n=1 Tax=Mycoplasma sp. 1018B TaxID=2967302 RepID=UPI00211C2398|nr:S8 family serine peptidase [Mycoplasma sp. 1018B]UUM19135.1 S8 family serine peptidase [Mycoplasma sp. 1018B]
MKKITFFSIILGSLSLFSASFANNITTNVDHKQDQIELNNKQYSKTLIAELKDNLNNNQIQELKIKLFNLIEKNNINSTFKFSDILNIIFINLTDHKNNYLIYNFLNENEMIEFYFEENNKFIENNINQINKLPVRIERSYYQKYFDVNNFNKDDRYKLIDKFKNSKNKIKVGILEVRNHIDSQNQTYFNKNIYNTKIINKYKGTETKHGTRVASIIAGLDGVNPNVELYSSVYKKTENYWTELEDLLKEKVNIINMSFGEKNPKDYNFAYNYSAWLLDRYAKKYPEVIFVVSAGNDNTYLNGFKLANNIIVVGANDINKNKAYYSSYNAKTGKQVTLLAQRTFEDNNYEIFNGTSFSAPFISGILSYTLQAYKDKYDLGKNNIIALSTLSASTLSNNKNNETIGFNGVGIFDYDKLDQAFKNLIYYKRYWHEPMPKNYSKLLTTFSVKKGETIRGALSWETTPEITENFKKYNAKTVDNLVGVKKRIRRLRGPVVHSVTENYNIKNNSMKIINNPEEYINVTNDFDLELYDSENKLVFSSNSTTHNVEFIKYTAEKDGNYTFRYVNKYTNYKHNDIAFTYTIERKNI